MRQLKEQFSIEKELIDTKYQQQLQVLEKKPQNAITKKLISKVQNEWTKAVEKKRKEMEEKLPSTNIDKLDISIQ